jgi:hypothetical protein
MDSNHRSLAVRLDDHPFVPTCLLEKRRAQWRSRMPPRTRRHRRSRRKASLTERARCYPLPWRHCTTGCRAGYRPALFRLIIGGRSSSSSGESVLRTAPIPSHLASIRSLRQWVPSGMARGAPKISKIGWRNAPKTPPKRARRGSRKERPGWAGCRATVVVISPPDVSLTGSVYDSHAAWVFISDQASHAGRRRDLLPLALLLPSQTRTPSTVALQGSC